MVRDENCKACASTVRDTEITKCASLHATLTRVAGRYVFRFQNLPRNAVQG